MTASLPVMPLCAIARGVLVASMNISVPDPMREWVEQRVGTGQYASASDYVRDLIRRDQAKRNEMREQIGAGLAPLRAAKGIDGEAFLAELDAGLAKQK